MTSQLPSITVITPSLNQGAFIENAIQSVLRQNYPRLEYFIMDGGSTDRTLDILQRYSGQIQWWSEPDRGQSHAINKGIERASGEIVAVLNADDEYEEFALLTVGDFFARHPEAMWCVGKCKIINEQGEEILPAVTFYKNFLMAIGQPWLLYIVNFIPQPATFWRRSLVGEIGVFKEDLHYVMDYDYWLRIAKRYPLYKINAYLAKFRTLPTSKTRQAAMNQYNEENNMIRRHAPSLPLLVLHDLHRWLNVVAYRLLFRDR